MPSPKKPQVKRVVLAYSGGLDTSIILKWLQTEYGAEVITFTADLGQGEELKTWAAEGRSGVMTCSALKRAYRDRIRSARPDVRFVYVKGSETLIEARVAARHHEYMPASLLRSQFDTLEEPTPDEPGIVTVDAGGSADEEVAAVIATLNLSPSRQS